MAKFSYGPFSGVAREAVVMAADIALDEGSGSVMPEHLQGAVGGAVGGERPVKETGRVPFDVSTMAVLERAHDVAVVAGETVELRHLRDALDKRGG